MAAHAPLARKSTDTGPAPRAAASANTTDRALNARSAVVAQRVAAVKLSQSRAVIQRYGDPGAYDQAEPLDAPPELTPEGSIAEMGPDEMVTLARGVSPSQHKVGSTDAIQGSYVGHQKMLSTEARQSNPEIEAPSGENALDYVKEGREGPSEGLVEFSSIAEKATKFASEARFAHTYYVRIARKYLTKGSSGEGGWIASQTAPYTIVHATKRDLLSKAPATRMSGADLTSESQKENDAELLVDVQTKGAPTVLNSVPKEEKMPLALRIAAIKKRYGEQNSEYFKSMSSRSDHDSNDKSEGSGSGGMVAPPGEND